MIDVYESSIDGSGLYGAVFERDDYTAYFYLLDMHNEGNPKIVLAFDAAALTTCPSDVHVAIRWSATQAAAGLFVDCRLKAIVEVRNDQPTGRWAEVQDEKLFALH